MTTALRGLLLLAVLWGCCACSWMRKRPKAAGPAFSTIGRIELVQPEQQFVLIRCEPAPLISAGTKLWALAPDGRRLELRLGSERKGYYFVADVIGELPALGDSVLLEASDLNPKAP